MAIRVATKVKARAAGAAPEAEIDPAFHRAIVRSTIRSMRLDPVRFRRYLGENGAKNMSLLLATARTMGP